MVKCADISALTLSACSHLENCPESRPLADVIAASLHNWQRSNHKEAYCLQAGYKAGLHPIALDEGH
jgi:putative hemolysin